MSTLYERRDYIAQCLLERGLNKTSIIAIMNNGYIESGRTYSPTVGEYSGGGGFGIWQWTNNHNQSQIEHYAKTHSEKDAIKWQCNYLVDDRGQWISVYGISFDQFLHNTGNWDWKYLTKVFCFSWERPNALYAHLDWRYQAYEINKDINWGNAPAGGDNENEPSKPEWHKKKYPTMRECMSLFDKQHSSNNTTPQPDKPSPIDPPSSGFDNKSCLEFFNKYKGKLFYTMDLAGRQRVEQGISADCSSFVSFMLQLGYHDNDNFKYSTETLHDRLTRLGYKCVEQGSTLKINQPVKTGDVIIEGRRGYSAGAGGHTGICLDAPTFHDCSYSKNGLGSYASAQAFLNWHYNTNYYYHYSK